MITEKNKAARIMKEIVSYYLEHQLYTFDLHFDISPQCFELRITADTETLPETFPQLLEDLNVPRQIELDEYCNALLGSHNLHEDYTALGRAIDEAQGEFIDGKLSLTIKRCIEE